MLGNNIGRVLEDQVASGFGHDIYGVEHFREIVWPVKADLEIRREEDAGR